MAPDIPATATWIADLLARDPGSDAEAIALAYLRIEGNRKSRARASA